MSDGDTNPALTWALAEAQRLLKREQSGSPSHAETAPALEFLRHHAGRMSAFVQQIERGDGMFAEDALRAAAMALQGWVEYVSAGFGEPLPPEAQARVQASTDLMEQVHALLDDGKVHAAAPVVLAGAALEEFLRSLMIANGLSLKGKPSITAYAGVLHAADVIDDLDLKDVSAWSGLRNAAAHGAFATVGRERALIMADGINLFMRKHEPGRTTS